MFGGVLRGYVDPDTFGQRFGFVHGSVLRATRERTPRLFNRLERALK